MVGAAALSISSPRFDNQLPQSQQAQKDQDKRPSTLVDHIASLKHHFAQIHQQLAEVNGRLNSLEARFKQKEDALAKSDEELGKKIADISQEFARKLTENSEEIRKLNVDQDKKANDVRQKLNDDIVKVSHLTEELGRNLRELKSTFDGGMTKLNDTKLNKAEFDAFRDEVGQVLGKLVSSLEESFPEYAEAESIIEQVRTAEQAHGDMQQPRVVDVTAAAPGSSQDVENDVLKVRLLKDEDKDKHKFSWWK